MRSASGPLRAGQGEGSGMGGPGGINHGGVIIMVVLGVLILLLNILPTHLLNELVLMCDGLIQEVWYNVGKW